MKMTYFVGYFCVNDLLLSTLIINSLSMKLTVNLPRIQSTLIKNVRCNGKNYPISFPHSAPSFIEIIQSMEVGKEHERMLAILSKQSNELESI